MNRIQLSDHFTYGRLLRFVFPAIAMMVFTSIYTVVDGFFVSNYVGKLPFAAVNLIWPYLMAFGVVGFMVGTGGSALVSRSLGENHPERARQEFSLLVYFTIATGILLTILGIVLLEPVARLLGAKGEIVDMCVLYGSIIMAAQTAFMLQSMFQSFFVTAEKPQLGLTFTLAAGFTNMVLDWLLVAVFPLGLVGAALATAMSQVVGGIGPLIYFAHKNGSLLWLTRTSFSRRIILQTCANGSSELMTNLSSSVVSALYNLQLLRLVGEDGVAAYGVIMYANFVFAAIFLGYSIGMTPVVGYHYGADNTGELKNLLKKSLVLMAAGGAGMLSSSQWLAEPLSRMFVGYDPGLLVLTIRGFRLYALSFLLLGFNIFGSAFFTALSNGPVSAAISFLRTLLFQVVAILILPEVLPGADGVWLSVVAAEALALVVTGYFLIKMKNKYQYA